MDSPKTKKVKVVTLDGTFPERPSSKMYATGRGQAGNIKAAFAAAGRELFKHKNLRGARITAAKLVMSVGTIEVEA